MLTFHRQILLAILLLGFSGQLIARQDYLQAWDERYPNSTSSRRSCQLCHQRADGGDGWNSYGISIRFKFIGEFGSSDIDAAIASVEDENADEDSAGLTNLEEIQQGLDPGWLRGNVNSISFKDFTLLDNQSAPFLDVDGFSPESEPLCLVVQSKNGAIVSFCL